MRLVPQGEVGELIVAGRSLAAGYIRGRDSHKFLANPHAIDPGQRRKYRATHTVSFDPGFIVTNVTTRVFDLFV